MELAAVGVLDAVSYKTAFLLTSHLYSPSSAQYAAEAFRAYLSSESRAEKRFRGTFDAAGSVRVLYQLIDEVAVYVVSSLDVNLFAMRKHLQRVVRVIAEACKGTNASAARLEKRAANVFQALRAVLLGQDGVPALARDPVAAAPRADPPPALAQSGLRAAQAMITHSLGSSMDDASSRSQPLTAPDLAGFVPWSDSWSAVRRELDWCTVEAEEARVAEAREQARLQREREERERREREERERREREERRAREEAERQRVKEQREREAAERERKERELRELRERELALRQRSSTVAAGGTNTPPSPGSEPTAMAKPVARSLLDPEPAAAVQSRAARSSTTMAPVTHAQRHSTVSSGSAAAAPAGGGGRPSLSLGLGLGLGIGGTAPASPASVASSSTASQQHAQPPRSTSPMQQRASSPTAMSVISESVWEAGVEGDEGVPVSVMITETISGTVSSSGACSITVIGELVLGKSPHTGATLPFRLVANGGVSSKPISFMKVAHNRACVDQSATDPSSYQCRIPPQAVTETTTIVKYQMVGGRELLLLAPRVNWSFSPGAVDLSVELQADKSLPRPLTEVGVLAPVAGGVIDMQSTPTAQFSQQQQKVLWRLPAMDAGASVTTRAHFTVSGEGSAAPVALNFVLVGGSASAVDLAPSMDAQGIRGPRARVGRVLRKTSTRDFFAE